MGEVQMIEMFGIIFLFLLAIGLFIAIIWFIVTICEIPDIDRRVTKLQNDIWDLQQQLGAKQPRTIKVPRRRSS
jgi:hypothetical protein